MTATITSHTQLQFQGLARRHALPPEAAEQMMAIHQGHMDRLKGRRAALMARWAEQAKTKPDYGGRCGFPAAVHVARQAVARFGGERLRKALDDTGLGSHPEIIRAFWKVGKATEGQHPAGPRPAPSRPKTRWRGRSIRRCTAPRSDAKRACPTGQALVLR